jgi:hypothetical protein
LCPGAPTEVFEGRDRDASIADAVSSKGKAYTALANAFAYRQKSDASCTCRSPTAAKITYANDPTLQAGDIVVTETGVRVFRGGKKMPYGERDFGDYRGDQSLSAAQRAFLDSVDRMQRGVKVGALEKPENESTNSHAEHREQPASEPRWHQAAVDVGQEQGTEP